MSNANSFQPKDQTGANHHFLPNMYLKGFTERGKVGVWQRATGEVRGSAPIKIAKIKGFYTYRDKEGKKSDELEKVFADMEGYVKGVIYNVNSLFPPPITGEYKFALAQYLAFQHLRTPVKRKEIEQTADLAMKLQSRINMRSKEEVIRWLKEAGHEPTEELIKQAEDFYNNPHDFQIVPSKEEVLKVQLQSAPLITTALMHREWHIVMFDAPSLVTSDDPVLLMPDDDALNDGFRGTGFANAKEIWFPLSSTRLLVLSRQDYKGRRVFQGNPALAQRVNEVQLASSYMEAFGPPAVMKQYENQPLGARGLSDINAGFDKEFFEHYNKPPLRPRPVNK